MIYLLLFFCKKKEKSSCAIWKLVVEYTRCMIVYDYPMIL